MIEDGARWTFRKPVHTKQGTAGLPSPHAQRSESGNIGHGFGGLLREYCTHCDLRRPDGGAWATAEASSAWSCASPEREERLEGRDLAMAAGSGGSVAVGDAMEVMVAVWERVGSWAGVGVEGGLGVAELAGLRVR